MRLEGAALFNLPEYKANYEVRLARLTMAHRREPLVL
jgi:hypothetical protein